MASLCRVPVRHLVSAAFRDPNFVRKAPYPYLTRDYNSFWQLFDKTTTRWDENTKLIVLEGSSSPEKTELAKKLARDFGMVHMPSPSVDEFFYRTQDKRDFRLFNELLPPRVRPYAESEFFANPFGFAEGASDRYFYLDYVVKFTNYVFAMRHMFNTGEGVIVEGNPFSAFVQFNAALRSKYIAPSTKNHLNYAVMIKHRPLLRPNLIIHLDVDSQKASQDLKKKYAGDIAPHNPVWDNLAYLNDISLALKREYLNEAKKHSLVLVYDWNEAGEHDIIVEDMERLNLDWYDVGELQQKDWYMQVEDNYEMVRRNVTNYGRLRELLNFENLTDSMDAEHLIISAHEAIRVDEVLEAIDSERYRVGWNPYNGINAFFKNSTGAIYLRPTLYKKRKYPSVHTESFVYPEADAK